MSETTENESNDEAASPVDVLVRRLYPKAGDEFIAKPQLNYSFSMTVRGVYGADVSIVTAIGTTMLIPIVSWNRYVIEGKII